MKRGTRPPSGERTTRRDFLTKAAYVAPAILTLPAVLSVASAGSGKPGPAPAPYSGGGGGSRGDSCDWSWWHIFFCFPF